MPENVTLDPDAAPAATGEFEPVNLAPKPSEAVAARGTPSAPLPLIKRRRSEPRFAAVEDRIWMQWWDEDVHLGRAARLVNLSRHGAMIVSPVLFRAGQRLAIFLEEPAPQVGVVGTVLGAVEGLSGRHQVRIKFRSACPDDFLDAAANGFESWLAGTRTKV